MLGKDLSKEGSFFIYYYSYVHTCFLVPLYYLFGRWAPLFALKKYETKRYL